MASSILQRCSASQEDVFVSFEEGDDEDEVSLAWDPNQPRDADGRWSSDPGSSSTKWLSSKDVDKIDAWHSSLAPQEIKALNKYVAQYKKVRAVSSGLAKGDKNTQEIVAALDSALDRAPSLSQDVLWRGISNVTEKDAAQFTRVGAKITMKGFTSWTNSNDVAQDFSAKYTKQDRVGVLFEVRSGMGGHMIDNFEGEILAQRNKQYRIEKVTKVTTRSKSGKSARTYRVKLKELK